MSRSIALVLFGVLAAACAGKPKPGAPEARKVVEDHFAKLGSFEDFKASEGFQMRLQNLPDVYWTFEVSVALKAKGDVYWQDPVGQIRYSIGSYQIPGDVKHLTEFSDGYQASLRNGEATSGVTPIPAGSSIVFDGTVSFREAETGYVLNQFQVRRRGYCEGMGVESCYAKHQVPVPAVPAQ